MVDRLGFATEAWNRLRSKALAALVDQGEYLIIWAGVTIAHVVKVAVAAVGIDPDIIHWVSIMEKWVWIASFVSFFWRILLRVWRSL